jgi:hypothetical protein
MKEGASLDICDEIYAGSGASSEPETVAIQNFILSKQWMSYICKKRKRKEKKFKKYLNKSCFFWIALHSYGGFWLHHWERTDNADEDKQKYIKIVLFL